jgi:hypothetical protein
MVPPSFSWPDRATPQLSSRQAPTPYRPRRRAIPTTLFVRWLDAKFDEQADKVVPPQQVLRDELDGQTMLQLERLVAAEIVAAGGFTERVETAMIAAREKTDALDLERIVRSGLDTKPEQRWDKPLGSTAADIAAGVLNS